MAQPCDNIVGTFPAGFWCGGYGFVNRLHRALPSTSIFVSVRRLSLSLLDRIDGPACQDLGSSIFEEPPAFVALNLAARGLGEAPTIEEHDRGYGNLVLLRHRFLDRF